MCTFGFSGCHVKPRRRRRFGLVDGAEMADVGQMKQMVPFVTCEITLVNMSAN